MFAVACALVGAALGPLLAALVAYGPLHRGDDHPPFAAAVRAGYPLAVTVVSALAMAGIGAIWPARAVTSLPLVLVASMVVASAIDLEHLRLPDRITFPTVGVLVALAVGLAVVDDMGDRLVAGAIGALAFSGFLLVFNLVYPAGMGFGDVKYALALGFVLGFAGLRLVMYGVLFGSLIGSLVGIGVAIARRTHKAAFPYGPALCAGTYVALLLVNHLD